MPARSIGVGRQYLDATYLPLTGGTLTGALAGTTADFSGNVGVGGAGVASGIGLSKSLLVNTASGSVGLEFMLAGVTKAYFSSDGSSYAQLLTAGAIPLSLGYNNAAVITLDSTGGTFPVVGAGTILKRGANGRVGTFVCNGVTPVTVNNTSVAITDVITISLNAVGGTVGAVPAVKTITASTGFTVAGTASDTSTYNYHISKSAA